MIKRRVRWAQTYIRALLMMVTRSSPPHIRIWDLGKGGGLALRVTGEPLKLRLQRRVACDQLDQLLLLHLNLALQFGRQASAMPLDIRIQGAQVKSYWIL